MTKTHTQLGPIALETRGSVLIARLDGGPRGELGPDIANALTALLDKVESDASVSAVVITGTHPGRFIGHADVRWLQEGGKATPIVGRSAASAIARTASTVRRTPGLAAVASVTPLSGAVELDRFHNTLFRMNTSGVIFIAALNGSALGIGSELALACDMRLMADGDFFIGQPEILLGFNPGGGGTQRLPRLIGAHKALMMMLEGRPASPQKALEIGYVDELVAPDALIERAVTLGQYFGSRSRGGITAIKRSVNIGAFLSLEEGLHVERTEFLKVLPTQEAQGLMLDYMADTDHRGDLPLYSPAAFEATLKSGRFSSKNNESKE